MTLTGVKKSCGCVLELKSITGLDHFWADSQENYRKSSCFFVENEFISLGKDERTQISIYGGKEKTLRYIQEVIMFGANFLIAQVLGFVALVIYCLSYVVKSRNLFFLLTTVAELLYALPFIFLCSIGTGIIFIVSGVQNLCFYLHDKKGEKMPQWEIWAFIVSFVLIGGFSAETAYDVLPIVANVVSTFAYNEKNMTKLRLMSFIPSLLSLANDVLVKAYANAFEDGFEATFLAVMICLDCVKSHGFKTKIKSATLNKIQSRLFWKMGVINNLQSTENNLDTGDNQVLFALKETFVPMVFLKRETPIPPS